MKLLFMLIIIGVTVSMNKWNGKTAVVTGASAGIGEAIVRDFVKHGINVVTLARRLEKLKTLKDQLKDEPGKVIPIKCDVSDKASIDTAFEQIGKEVGTIQILVNNAGIGQFHDIFENDDDKTDEILSSIINTNFLGLVRVARKGFKLIKKSDDYGIILNIGSVAGHNASLEYPMNVYPGTKFAVRAFTESMRQELNRMKDSKIRVCEISPGFVSTDIGGGSLQAPEIIATLPMLKTSDVSQTVLFVLMTPYEVNITELIVKPVGEKN